MINNQEIGELVSLIKKDDQRAFRKFFLLFQADIFRFLYRFLADKENAEDICQETFINFWLNRNKVDPYQYPRAYLYKIAKNLAFNFLERNNPSLSYDDEIEINILTVINPEKDYENKDIAEICQKAINELPEKCRMTFILSRFHGFDYSEISEAMDVSLQTVKNQISKALTILRAKLSPIYQNK